MNSKIKNILQANLILESNYLKSKGFLSEEEQKISYSCVLLDEASVKLLSDKAKEVNLVNDSGQNVIGVPADFVFETKASEKLPHHMTITMGPLGDAYPDWLKQKGRKVLITVTAFGLNDKAMAAKVKPPYDVNPKIKIPHITIAIPKGGKPADSSTIKNWTPISDSFTVSGVITEIPQK